MPVAIVAEKAAAAIVAGIAAPRWAWIVEIEFDAGAQRFDPVRKGATNDGDAMLVEFGNQVVVK